QQAIERSVKVQGGHNITIDIDQYPELKTLLPSTPAVIIYNANRQLVYLGPYADGAFCTTETSFVEQLLPEINSNKLKANGGWVNTVANGCYCNVAI
ncbi:MAG TPA: thioredoxin, partial [Idiomarina sp.]|nr:thioredoxin [Idiomarina sp.]